MKRRILAVLGVFVILALVAVIAIAGTLYSIFGHSVPMQTGTPVGPATTIVDGFAAAYSVPTDSGVVLIDAGVDSGGAAIIEALASQGYTPQDVQAIFLTHGHSDHIGAAERFSAPVYAMREEVDLIEGRVASDSPVGRLSGPNDGTVTVDHELTDGQSIDIDGLTVRAYRVAGHTPGSAVYVVGNAVFMGDSATAHDDGTMVGAVGIFSEDTEQNAHELRALAGRLPPEVDIIGFGHSGPAPIEQLGAFARTVQQP